MMRRRGRRAMARGRTDTTTISDDLAGSQARDLLSTEPKLDQDCRSILAPLRRSCTQRIGMSTQRERLTHQMNGAKHGVLYRLCHAQMLHLRIFEHLIDSVNGSAGDTGLISDNNCTRLGAICQAMGYWIVTCLLPPLEA